MKKLYIFRNGDRIIADSQALISPHPLNHIQDEHDLSNATDEEIEKLKNNPKDDKLLQEIQKRHKLR